jgi:ATP-dependent Zn protease
VEKLLTDHRRSLDQMAERLLHDETIDDDVIEEVVGPRPAS